MKSRSKTNNLVAILIALFLFALGFALLFVHQQKKSDKKSAQSQTLSTMTDKSIQSIDKVKLLSGWLG